MAQASFTPTFRKPGHPPEMAVVVMSVEAPPELTRAIASLLAQDVAIELIIVNSGGGDVHARLPAGAGHAKVLASTKRIGPGAARNLGIEASEAPYVAFLAADCIADEGWVERRLRRHRAGAEVVASSVVNSHPRSIVAWASHLTLYAERLPGIHPQLASLYGASYSRETLNRHGLFEDIRVGEDTRFHQRVAKLSPLEWAPEVRTIHENPTSLRASWRDIYRRGVRSGTFWPRIHQEPGWEWARLKFERILKSLDGTLEGSDKLLAYASLPLVVINLVIFHRGAEKGKLQPDKVVAYEARAREAAKLRHWEKSLQAWTKADKLQPGRMTPLMGQGRALLQLGRSEEAEAIFSAVCRKWPNLLPGHVGLARAAEMSQQWELAMSSWAEADRIVPGDIDSEFGRGRILLALGRTDEARAVFLNLRETFPHDPAGEKGLAMVAMSEQDWDVAVGAYRRLWTEFSQTGALRKLLFLLVNLNRISETGVIVNSLQTADIQPLVRVRMTLIHLEALHDWEGMVSLLTKNQELLLGDPELLQKHLGALVMLGRSGEVLPIINRSQAGKPAFRKTLEITALLRDRRYEDATAAFQEIWESRELTSIPVMLLSALLAAAMEKGGTDLATHILDRIAADRSVEKSSIQLRRISRFYRARLVCLEANPTATPEPALESQIAGHINTQTDRTRQSDDGRISEICRLFARWRTARPAFFPDTSFVLTDALEVAIKIIQAVDLKTPFSLLRLGDGEGNLLPYRQELRNFIQTDRVSTQRTWWGGPALEDADGEVVVEALRQAIRSADVIGIPDIWRVCRVLGGGSLFEPTGTGRSARGLLAVIDFMESSESGDQVLTSCHIHQSFSYWGIWDVLLPRLGEVSLITCHGELARNLSDNHGVRIRETHLIPSETKYSAVIGDSHSDSHYPAFYHQLRVKLAATTPGQVWLVAAGMLGKIYCQWIKDAGGIAIDVGSVVDFWCGYETRSIDEAAYFRGPTGMRERFEKLAANDPRIARLLWHPLESGNQSI